MKRASPGKTPVCQKEIQTSSLTVTPVTVTHCSYSDTFLASIGSTQELLIRKKDGPSQKFMGTERESRERAQDANVVGAGNLNVGNK